MQYTKYMERCRQCLVDTMEMESDYDIGVSISVHKVCNEVNETFTLYDVENCDITGDLAIKSLSVGYLDKIRLIENSMHPTNNNTSVTQRKSSNNPAYIPNLRSDPDDLKPQTCLFGASPMPSLESTRLPYIKLSGLHRRLAWYPQLAFKWACPDYSAPSHFSNSTLTDPLKRVSVCRPPNGRN
jgi:hypothetical protein